MDKIDEKLLSQIDKNPRFSLKQLAKKTKVSSQVADYRIKRMMKEGIITNFSAIINLEALGFEHYRIFFTFNGKKEYTNKVLFNYLKDKKGVYWAARIGGKYDLQVSLFVRGFEEFDSFIDSLNKKFPGLVKDYKACYVLEHTLYNHKFLNSGFSEISYGYKDKKKDIDKLDYHILSKINENCRLSSLEIARGTKATYKTIINRIKSLEKKRIILGYRLFIKSLEERPYILLLSFRDYQKEKEKEFLSNLNKSRQVTQVLRMFGVWNVYLHVRAKNNEELQDFIIKLRDRFEIINDYEIIPVFEDIAINLLPLK